MGYTAEPGIQKTRRGFVTNYPPFRYWRAGAVPRILSPEPLNVYIHIPFCVKRCAFCYYKVSLLRDNPKHAVDDYVDALCREIALAAELFQLKKRPTKTVYFGGGTPSLLDNDVTEREILNVCRRILRKVKK